MKITSLTNARIKQLVKLRDRRQRNTTGLTVIDGIREVSLAKKNNFPLEEMYYCPEILRERPDTQGLLGTLTGKNKGAVYEVSRDVFEKISYGERYEGLLAVGRAAVRPFNAITITKGSLFVIMENIEKPGNLGAVLRTCDCVGVDGLIVTDENFDIFNPNIIRASCGTVFSVPVYQQRAETVFEHFKKNKVGIVATTPNAEKPYTHAEYDLPMAVLLGSEHMGLSAYALNQADRRVKIPMKGQADSLNVSVAAAVLLYEIIRQQGR